MYLKKLFEENDCKIAVASISNNMSEIQNLANLKGIINIKSQKRKAEKITIRLLLNQLMPGSLLSYNNYGAPIIEGKEISISHSNDLAAIVISNKKVGIDIEKISTRLQNTSSKFTYKYKNISVEEATLIWCAKEAIFKWYSKGNINFRKDIVISPFKVQENGMLNANFKNFQYTLHYMKLYKHFLVYVCN